MVRARRQVAGELGAEIRIGAKAFSVGDRVIFEKNQRVRSADLADTSRHPELVRLRNGTFGTVVALTDTGNAVTREGDVRRAQGDVAGIAEEERSEPTGSLVVQLDDGRRAVLPRSYAEASTSLGYALTVFRSQGITVDHTFGLGGDSLYQEAGYTQLSRGRLSNNLYVASPENPRWEIGHHADDLAQRDALESLVGALSQNKEQTMARDRLPTWPSVSADDFASAYREHASLGRWIADHAPTSHQSPTSGAWRSRVPNTSGPEPKTTSTNLAAAQRRRDAWVGAHQGEIERWSQLERDLRRHEYRLGQAAAYSPPDHTAAVLGPLPERISGVERWQSAAGAIEAYRSRWNVTTADALGPEPLDPEQAAHWQRAVSCHRVGRVRCVRWSGWRTRPGMALVTVGSGACPRHRPARMRPATSTSMPEPSHFAWSRDVDFGHDLDGGFGL